MNTTDNLKAIEATKTMIVTSSPQLNERAVAEGTYTASMIGPREIDRDRYIRIRDALTELIARGLVYRTLNKHRIDYLTHSLNQFELVQQWEDTAPNLVTTAGKNLALDTFLSGSSYTVVGPFMGLISSVSYTAVAVTDIMTSHGGWLEAGATNAPTYSGTRKTAAWSSASGGSKALSTALSFSMTGSGTVKGCFLVYGAGAVATVDNTAGILYSAGTFTGGDQPVVNGNTLNVSYTASL